MIPKFKAGDIVFLESIYGEENIYIHIDKIENNFYFYSIVNRKIETKLTITTFEEKCFFYKEPILLTDEDKLRLI